MLSFMFLLFVQTSCISFEDYDCSNISPNDQGCNQLAQEGICEIMNPQYCALSCKTCCVDKAPGNMNCQTIASLPNACDYFIKHGYCLRSCNACHKLTEIYGLNSLKQSIQYPDQLSTWTGWEPCNNFNGIICQKNRVSELRLGEYYFNFNTNAWINTDAIITNAASTIPAQLSVLEDLNGLWMGRGGFSGPLPPEFSAFFSLKGVYFADQSLSGFIPPQYSVWEKINVFYAWGNALTGNLPVQFSTWKNLIKLDLQSNQLLGGVPKQFSTWSNIDFFWIYYNMFTGNLPLEFSTWRNIENFEACKGDGNNICIPEDFYGPERIAKDCPVC